MEGEGPAAAGRNGAFVRRAPTSNRRSGQSETEPERPILRRRAVTKHYVASHVVTEGRGGNA